MRGLISNIYNVGLNENQVSVGKASPESQAAANTSASNIASTILEKRGLVDQPEHIDGVLGDFVSIGGKDLEQIAKVVVDEKAQGAFANNVARSENYTIPPSLSGRMLLSTPTTWSKFKEAISLTFQGIAKIFKGNVKWENSQNTDPILTQCHVDHKGNVLGTETIQRKDGISDLIASKVAEIEYLSKQDQSDPTIGTKILKLVQEKNALVTHAHGDKWATANRVRDEGSDFLKRGSKLSPEETYAPASDSIASIDAELNSLLKQEKSDETTGKKILELVQQKNTLLKDLPIANRVRDEGSIYLKKKPSKLSPQETYIPAVVNNREHKIEYVENGVNKSVPINRSGAISHLADGTTNLAKLKADYSTKIESLNDILKNINQEDQETRVQIQKDIEEIQDDIRTIGNNLEARQQILDDQMVQYLKGQVGSFAKAIKDPNSVTRLTNTLQVTQIGLLNPKKEKVEKGVFISERNQMWDMAEIFKEFSGKQIQFTDGIDDPFLDGDSILIPRSLLGEMEDKEWELLKAKPLNLSCTFLNFSVQGLKKNVGDQAIINLQGINILHENLGLMGEAKIRDVSNLRARLVEIEERLDEEESSYEIATDLLVLLKDMEGVVGANCYSGKDRTGNFLVKVAYHYLGKSIDGSDSTEEEKKLAKRKLASDLTSIDALSSEVIEQNTGHKFNKAQGPMLGMNSREDSYGLVGHFYRIAYAINAWRAKS